MIPAHIQQRLWILVLLAYGVQLLVTGMHEILTAPAADLGVFLTIGRGMLNGLTPYADLFDFKPPGIFLLSALSLLLTNGYTGLLVFSACIAIALPASVVLSKNKSLTFFAALSAIAMWILAMAGNGMPESFGAFFGCLTVLLLSGSMRGRHIIAGISAGLAISCKEPFALSIVAACIVLFPDPKTLLRQCLIPTICAVLTWLMVLLVSGSLAAYVTDYLPFTFAMRVSGNPMLQGLMVHDVATKLWEYSPIFLLLVVTIFAQYARQSWKIGIVAVTTLFMATLATEMAQVTALTQHMTTLAVVILAWFLKSPQSAAVTVLLMVFPFTVALPTITPQDTWQQDMRDAKVINTIMDDCNIDRYMHVGNIGTFVPAFILRSPVGPAFFISDYTSRIARLALSYPNNIDDVQLILFQKVTRVLGSEKVVYDSIQNQSIDHFTIEPWPCVKQNLVSKDYVLMYRKQ